MSYPIRNKSMRLILKLFLIAGLFLATLSGAASADDSSRYKTQNTTQIVGTVLKPDESIFKPGSNSDVYVYLRRMDNSGGDISGSQVNSNGNFMMTANILTGDYLLAAEAQGSGNPYASAMPLPVHITEGQVLMQNISLTDPVITGQVLDPDGNVFIPEYEYHVYLHLRHPNGDEISGGGVRDNGTFKLGGNISPGDYLLTADANGINNPYANAAPSLVHITTGQQLPLTQNISLTVPVMTGQVLTPEGSVFIPTDQSQANVQLFKPDGEYICGAGVQSNGVFKLGGHVPPGNYIFIAEAQGNNPYTNSTPLPVCITEGETLTLNIRLTNPVITGQVLTPDDDVFIPANESHVYLHLRHPDGYEVSSGGVRNNGIFKLGGNIPPGDYLLGADANGINNPYANSVPVMVHITEGQTLTQNISLTNPVIIGQVLDPDGNVFIPGDEYHAYLHLRHPNGDEICGGGVRADGTFKLGGSISPGEDYLLSADANGIYNPFANSAPVTIHITSGQQLPLTQNISLTNPVITGQVLTPEGSVFIPTDQSRANVQLLKPNGEYLCGAGVQNNGTFKLGGYVPTGNYIFIAEAQGDNPYTNSIPLPVYITEGQTLAQNISLTSPVITGQVLTPDDDVFIPANESHVYLHLRHPDGYEVSSGGVRNNGTFKLGGNIPPGDYWLSADANGINNPYANSVPIMVHITEGQTLTQNISLTNPVIIGQVLDPDGNVFIPGDEYHAYLHLRHPNGDEICGGGVRADGTFKLGGSISPGEDYLLIADANGIYNPFANSAPVTIHIAPGQQLPVTQDLSLTKPVLRGSVLQPDGSPFLPGQDSSAFVLLMDSNHNLVCISPVRDNGTFLFREEIATGSYLFEAHAEGTSNPYASAMPIQIYVTVGQTLVQDILLTIPVIKGHVLKPDGDIFIPGQDSTAAVYLKNPDSDIICGVKVDNDGSFKMGGISTGDYLLTARVFGSNNIYADAIPIPLHITEGELLIQNISLTELHDYNENTGTLVYLNLEGGFLGIIGDDGVKYRPVNQPLAIQPGSRVHFKWIGIEGAAGYQMWGKAVFLLDITVLDPIPLQQSQKPSRPRIPSPVMRSLPKAESPIVESPPIIEPPAIVEPPQAVEPSPIVKPLPIAVPSPKVEPSPVAEPSPLIESPPAAPIPNYSIRISPDRPQRP